MLEEIEFIIPCGGKSTRNYPHAKGLAHKCLMPFGSIRLIDHVLKDIVQIGGRHITIVCSSSELIQNFKEALNPTPEIAQKLRQGGKESIAAVLDSIELPSDVDIKYVIQEKPLGTAHVLGLAHRASKNRHGVMIFPDDILLAMDEKNSPLKQMLDVFQKDEKQILLLGVEKEDVSNNAIIVNGRLIEKPTVAINHIAGFSPIIVPKEALDYMEQRVDDLERGAFKPAHTVKGEWVYTDGINAFLDETPHSEMWPIRMVLKSEQDTLLDTGTLPLYEHGMLLALLTRSKYKEEHVSFVRSFLKKLDEE